MCSRLIFLMPFILFYPIVISCNRHDKRIEAEKLYIEAVDAYAKQQYVDARNLVSRALVADSKFYQAAFLEGKILFFMDNRPEAEKIFMRLSARYPAFIEARVWYINTGIHG